MDRAGRPSEGLTMRHGRPASFGPFGITNADGGMLEPLAEIDWGNTIQLVGIIALPVLLLMFKWQAKRDQRLIDKGRELATEDTFKKQTTTQTRTLAKYIKKQVKLLGEGIQSVRNEFAAHDEKDTKRFDAIERKLDIVIKNGHDD